MADEKVEGQGELDIPFEPVTYYARKSGLRVARKGRRRQHFQFKDGKLVLKSAEEAKEFKALLVEMHPNARGLIFQVDSNSGVALAKRHQQLLAQKRGQIIQGVQTAQHRAEQIHEVTTLLGEHDAASQGIALQNQIGKLGGQGQKGLVLPGDTPNPGEQVVAQTFAKQGPVTQPTEDTNVKSGGGFKINVPKG